MAHCKPTDIGRSAELWTDRWLAQQGFQIIATNYRCRMGEIDRIGLHDGTLVFVEIRYRRQGDPAATVGLQKQRRIIRTASYFLHTHPPWQHVPCRFDVLALSGQPLQVEWIPGAFEA